MTSSAVFDRALIEEATKKSGLVWVRAHATGAGATDAAAKDARATDARTGAVAGERHGDLPARTLWHVWHEGAACVVGDGPGEQPLAGLTDGGRAEVTVRSKDKGGRLVSWTATVRELSHPSPEWDAAVAELKGKRLNAPDGEGMPERWARECRVLRLEPTGETAPLPDGSLAQPPTATPATTRQPVPAGLPRLLLRKRGRRG